MGADPFSFRFWGVGDWCFALLVSGMVMMLRKGLDAFVPECELSGLGAEYGLKSSFLLCNF